MDITGITATGAGTPRVINAGIKRHVALQTTGQDNTGTFTSATVHLEITVNGTDYNTVGNVSLSGDGDSDLIEWTGVCVGYRYNVTAISQAGDADIRVTIIDEQVGDY